TVCFGLAECEDYVAGCGQAGSKVPWCAEEYLKFVVQELLEAPWYPMLPKVVGPLQAVKSLCEKRGADPQKVTAFELEGLDMTGRRMFRGSKLYQDFYAQRVVAMFRAMKQSAVKENAVRLADIMKFLPTVEKSGAGDMVKELEGIRAFLETPAGNARIQYFLEDGSRMDLLEQWCPKDDQTPLRKFYNAVAGTALLTATELLEWGAKLASCDIGEMGIPCGALKLLLSDFKKLQAVASSGGDSAVAGLAEARFLEAAKARNVVTEEGQAAADWSDECLKEDNAQPLQLMAKSLGAQKALMKQFQEGPAFFPAVSALLSFVAVGAAKATGDPQGPSGAAAAPLVDPAKAADAASVPAAPGAGAGAPEAAVAAGASAAAAPTASDLGAGGPAAQATMPDQKLKKLGPDDVVVISLPSATTAKGRDDKEKLDGQSARVINVNAKKTRVHMLTGDAKGTERDIAREHLALKPQETLPVASKTSGAMK
ncbi:unnamed protein product, partial [Prorocentrum cordatum]